jgi:hypothetical protein
LPELERVTTKSLFPNLPASLISPAVNGAAAGKVHGHHISKGMDSPLRYTGRFGDPIHWAARVKTRHQGCASVELVALMEKCTGTASGVNMRL